MHDRGKERREERGENEADGQDDAEGDDDGKLTAVFQKIAQHRDFLDQRLRAFGKDKGQHRRPDPARNRHGLAHEAARIGEDRRKYDDEGHDAVDQGKAFHPTLLCASACAKHFTHEGGEVGHFPHAHAIDGNQL